MTIARFLVFYTLLFIGAISCSELNGPQVLVTTSTKIHKKVKIAVLPVGWDADMQPKFYSSDVTVGARIFNSSVLCNAYGHPSDEQMSQSLATLLNEKGLQARFVSPLHTNLQTFDYVLDTSVIETACDDSFNSGTFALPMFLFGRNESHSEVFVKLKSLLIDAKSGVVKQSFINLGHSKPVRTKQLILAFFYFTNEKGSLLTEHIHPAMVSLAESVAKSLGNKDA